MYEIFKDKGGIKMDIADSRAMLAPTERAHCITRLCTRNVSSFLMSIFFILIRSGINWASYLNEYQESKAGT
jgi:hypothetical protein